MKKIIESDYSDEDGDDGDYVKKQKVEESNDGKTCWELSQMYFKGAGTDKNWELGFEWLKKSANLGNSKAQYNLAKMYKYGECSKLKINSQLEFEWLKKCAEQGNSTAQYDLAVSYRKGRGCEKNLLEALQWYKMSHRGGKLGYCNFFNLEEIDDIIEKFLENINKLEIEMKSQKERIDELEITVPIEGGLEYQEAKRRFDEHKKKNEHF